MDYWEGVLDLILFDFTAWQHENALCIVVKVERNLTLRCSLLVHEPMTLYSGEDLLDIWYWKMSYLPGASPFSLKDTGVPALPAAETGHVRRLTYINFAPHWMSSSGSVSRSAEEGSAGTPAETDSPSYSCVSLRCYNALMLVCHISDWKIHFLWIKWVSLLKIKMFKQTTHFTDALLFEKYFLRQWV